MRISVSFQLRFEEFRLASRLLSRGRFTLWYAVAGFVVCGTGLLVLRHGTQVVGVIFLVTAGIYAVALTFGARVRLRKLFAMACKPTEMVFEESRFTVKTAHTRVEVEWAGVIDVKETPELFLLYRMQRRLAVVVPTRAFDRDQLGEFQAFLGRRSGTATTAVDS